MGNNQVQWLDVKGVTTCSVCPEIKIKKFPTFFQNFRFTFCPVHDMKNPILATDWLAIGIIFYTGLSFMRVGILGINHKLADLKLRELLAIACQKRLGSKFAAVYEDHAFVLLSTCNRTEIYFSSEDLAHTHMYLLNILREEVAEEAEEFDQKLYSYFGSDCFLHLSRVTAGLDSAIIAETEIQGQVKAAYEASLECVSLPSDLHFIFQKSLKIGKQVRSELHLGRGVPDLEHAIFNAGSHVFSNPNTASVLFVGASGINQKILKFFRMRGFQKVSLCNRSFEQAHKLSIDHEIAILDWSLLSQWHEFDWIICGTKSPHFLLNAVDLHRSLDKHKLIIDLCVPRNVEPSLGIQPNITLLNIDQINRTLNSRKHSMNPILAQAEAFVSEATFKNIRIFKAKEQYRQKLLAIG